MINDCQNVGTRVFCYFDFCSHMGNCIKSEVSDFLSCCLQNIIPRIFDVIQLAKRDFFSPSPLAILALKNFIFTNKLIWFQEQSLGVMKATASYELTAVILYVRYQQGCLKSTAKRISYR